MAWASMAKKATDTFVTAITEDEALGDIAGHYVGGVTAIATADISYPVIQTTKWVAQVVKEECGFSSNEWDEDIIEKQYERSFC
jgi:hypothetical protein